MIFVLGGGVLMSFDKKIGVFSGKFDVSKARQCVKGIAMRDNKVLFLRSKTGEYFFPGGGIEDKETHQDTLRREMLEETGYRCKSINRYLGRILLRRPDKFEHTEMYELVSYFYLCELSMEQGRQSLTENEKMNGYQPIWAEAEEVWRLTRNFQKDHSQIDFLYESTLFVLSYIRNHLGIKNKG